MYKIVSGFTLWCLLLTACKNDDKKQEGDEIADGWSALFKAIKPPYLISDTGLLKNTDTARLPSATFSDFFPDSIKKNYFGKDATVRYTAMAKMVKDNDTYYFIKAATTSKKAVMLAVFDKENNFSAALPFLLNDGNANTTQVSSIDKNFIITKTVTLRNGPDIIGEGKEVLAYEPSAKSFSLIMQDALTDNPAVIVNPIDTFPKTNKLAGDYHLNKKNIVSVRDGRKANQLLVFLHTENETGDCIGQMKGEFTMTSASTATYRQGGDPCVLNLSFKGNTVSINEESGCGNYRGLDCPLTGNFTRKKLQPVKQTSVKPGRK